MLLIIPDTPDKLATKAIDLFRSRLSSLWRIDDSVVTVGPLLQASSPVQEQHSLIVLLGTPTTNPLLAQTLQALNIDLPVQPEAFVLYTGALPERLRGIGLSGTLLTVVAGSDSHGLLYGLGRLLRQFSGHSTELIIEPNFEVQTPAIRDRGVYFATHFNNFYECAPLDKVCHYIEEMALWGFNLLTFWLDMNWFPYGFWHDPTSRGMKMVHRLRTIGETARACGMQLGSVGVANEGFHFQPPAALRTDISARRGAFYMDSQICPSKPGGLEMILDNRRQVLELLGPLDLYVHWPYDSGGCGCALCSDTEHRWGQTFLKIGPDLAGLVKTYNPNARIIVSTWYCDAVERNLVYDLCNQGVDWFDGIMLETKHAAESQIPQHYAKLVFPEISMFDCFFTSYGCNGANPAPQRFAQQARAMAALGCGTTLYSEGMYEDVNKVVWANVLWDPKRDARAIVEEYSNYYFGSANKAHATNLILSLENTWGAKRLAETSPITAHDLFLTAESLQVNLPAPIWCQDRWRALRDRAEMDDLMVQIGTNENLLRSTRLLLEEAVYTEDFMLLRQKVHKFYAQIGARQHLVDRLFAVYWQYLEHFSTERTILQFIPDELLGKQNFQALADLLAVPLAIQDDTQMQQEVIKGIKRWFWFQGVEINYLFL